MAHDPHAIADDLHHAAQRQQSLEDPSSSKPHEECEMGDKSQCEDNRSNTPEGPSRDVPVNNDWRLSISASESIR
jgi:hypothetical protein